jgi:chemotaxis signal transduction protein
MRYLTFVIEDVRLGIKVDSVDAVGKIRQDKPDANVPALKTLDLGRELGIGRSGKAGSTAIICRIAGETYQLLVDKVLDLDNAKATDCHSWPSNLAFLGIYNGIIMTGDQLFFSLDLDKLTGQKKR